MTEKEKAKLIAEAKTRNKEIQQQEIVQNMSQNTTNKYGKIFAYVSFVCGIAAIVLMFMVCNVATVCGDIALICASIGIVMSMLASEYGYKHSRVGKMGFLMSCVAFTIVIVAGVVTVALILAAFVV